MFNPPNLKKYDLIERGEVKPKFKVFCDQIIKVDHDYFMKTAGDGKYHCFKRAMKCEKINGEKFNTCREYKY